jgi:hypothetical protein
MGKTPEGILGVLTGRIGPVSGYRRNGQNILRVAHSRTQSKNTPARAAQREKIKVCNDFTRAFAGTGFFNKSFPSYGDTGTGYNRATSAIMNLAIIGRYPYTAISYPLVLVSKGPLPGAENGTATVNEQGNILFSWTDNSGTGTAKAKDRVIVVAYFPGLKRAVFSVSAATRSSHIAVLQTNIMQGHSAETWIGILSEDEKNAANSVYTGGIDI